MGVHVSLKFVIFHVLTNMTNNKHVLDLDLFLFYFIVFAEVCNDENKYNTLMVK